MTIFFCPPKKLISPVFTRALLSLVRKQIMLVVNYLEVTSDKAPRLLFLLFQKSSKTVSLQRLSRIEDEETLTESNT